MLTEMSNQAHHARLEGLIGMDADCSTRPPWLRANIRFLQQDGSESPRESISSRGPKVDDCAAIDESCRKTLSNWTDEYDKKKPPFEG